MTLNIQRAEFVRSAAGSKDFPRDSLPQVAFAGRSNVGKSSVINRLLNRKNFARVGSAPGKTTHINYFCIDEKLYLVDLPGYGYAKVSQQEKARWAGLIQSWFDRPTADDQRMADYFRSAERPWVVVANKLDKLKKSEIEPNMALIQEVLKLSKTVKLIPFSAEKGSGREELLRLVLDHLEGNI